jgi:hypothetical protein
VDLRFADGEAVLRVIVSVPHTGTRTLAEITGYGYMHSYEYKTPQQVCNENGDEVLVAPLRDPVSVYGTWVARYSERSYMMDPDHPKSMESAWRGLAALGRQFDILYIPVDHPSRVEQLAILSERMGIPLETDWPKVGASGLERPDLPPRDLSWIYELPMVKTYYGG